MPDRTAAEGGQDPGPIEIGPVTNVLRDDPGPVETGRVAKAAGNDPGPIDVDTQDPASRSAGRTAGGGAPIGDVAGHGEHDDR